MSLLDNAEFWDQAYLEDRATWDIGTPTPVFDSMLRECGLQIAGYGRHGRLFSSPQGSSSRRVLVPGCGRGYDAMLFAQYGFEVTAVDFAPEAVKFLRAEAANRNLRMEILQDDLFTLSEENIARYEIVLEYTCICAIDPARRWEYLHMLHRLLAPGGYFIGLIFPIDGRPGGPPYAIERDSFLSELTTLFDVRFLDIPKTSIKPRRGKEILVIAQKKSVDRFSKGIIMKSLSDIAHHGFEWSQLSAFKQNYELRSRSELVGSLEFRSAFGTFATAKCGDGCWTFKRVGFWKRLISIRACNSEADIATFRDNTWSQGGTLEFPDGRAFKVTSNFWKSRLEFQNSADEVLLHFDSSGVFKLKATVHVGKGSEHHPALPLMVLFGWYYLVMMQHESAAA